MWGLPGAGIERLHWQVDSLPLSHQGSLQGGFLTTGPSVKSQNEWFLFWVLFLQLVEISSSSTSPCSFFITLPSLPVFNLLFFFFFRAGDVFSLFSFHFGLSFNSGSILFNLLSILHRSLENADHNSKIFEHKPPGWLKLLPSSLRSNIVLYRK